jgi:3-methyl-2-oxobutanoate hydroxymethyltransferase
MGGFKVQGKGQAQAARILADARELEQAGAFSLVLEGVPSALGASVTQALRIPTIGIGAGPGTDGQVLVYHDMLGLTTGKAPKFVKRYANLAEEIANAAQRYAQEVGDGTFPGPEHSYSHPAKSDDFAGTPAANGSALRARAQRDEVKYGSNV